MPKPTKTKLTNDEIQSFLSAKCLDEDCQGKTHLTWIQEVLTELFKKEDAFNGKRPFGNSGWKTDIEGGLIKSIPRLGIITFDEENYIDQMESDYDLDDCFKQIFNSLK